MMSLKIKQVRQSVSLGVNKRFYVYVKEQVQALYSFSKDQYLNVTMRCFKHFYGRKLMYEAFFNIQFDYFFWTPANFFRLYTIF